MSANPSAESLASEKLGLFQLTSLLLSVYVLIAVCVQTFFKLSPEMDSLLNRLDTGICFIFLWDFFHRLYLAPSKLTFLKWGWIDFLSSIPLLDQLRWGRFVRIVRLLRILRAFRSTKILLSFLFRNKARSTFATVAFTSLLLTIFSSIAILNFETETESNIKTPGDAIWWACTTITTVGYGDKYPITLEGRIVAIVLMTAGVGLFGTFTAFIATSFLGTEQRKKQEELAELVTEFRSLKHQVEALSRTQRGLSTPNDDPPNMRAETQKQTVLTDT